MGKEYVTYRNITLFGSIIKIIFKIAKLNLPPSTVRKVIDRLA